MNNDHIKRPHPRTIPKNGTFSDVIYRLPMSSIQDEVEKDCKVIRAAKHAKTKKTFEKFLAIQKDLQQTISEVRRSNQD